MKHSAKRRTLLAGIALGAALLGVGGVSVLLHQRDLRVDRLPLAIGGPFTLVDGNGQQVSDRDFRGKFLLIYFGYTFCPDVCPTTLNSVAAAIEQLGGKAANLQPLFITVDPQRDTPPVVKQYAAAFDPRLIGLTGTSEQIAQVANEYDVYYQTHRAGPGTKDYTVDHSSVLYLVGPDGRFIAPIRTDEPADAMATEIAKYLS